MDFALAHCCTSTTTTSPVNHRYQNHHHPHQYHDRRLIHQYDYRHENQTLTAVTLTKHNRGAAQPEV